LRGSSQYGLQAGWTLDIRILKCASGASSKNDIPPCKRIIDSALRFIAPETAILAPARKKPKKDIKIAVVVAA
jgi:hypothetical protein